MYGHAVWCAGTVTYTTNTDSYYTKQDHLKEINQKNKRYARPIQFKNEEQDTTRREAWFKETFYQNDNNVWE